VYSLKLDFPDPAHCILTLSTKDGTMRSFRFLHEGTGEPISAIRPIEDDGRALESIVGAGGFLDIVQAVTAAWRVAELLRRPYPFTGSRPDDHT
jgi:hypothetical protein